MDDGRLASPCRPDDGDRLPFPDCEADIFKDPFALIAEPDVFKLNFVIKSGQLKGAWRVLDIGLEVEHFVHPFGSHDPFLNICVLIGKFLYRLVSELQHPAKDDELRDGHAQRIEATVGYLEA